MMLQRVNVTTTCESTVAVEDELNKLNMSYRKISRGDVPNTRVFVGAYTEEEVHKLQKSPFVKNIIIENKFDTTKCNEAAVKFVRTAKDITPTTLEMTMANDTKTPLTVTITSTAEQLEILLMQPYVVKIVKQEQTKEAIRHIFRKRDKMVQQFIDSCNDTSTDTLLVFLWAGDHEFEGDTMDESKFDLVVKLRNAGLHYREYLIDCCSGVHILGRYTANELLEIEKLDFIHDIGFAGPDGNSLDDHPQDISKCSARVKEFVHKGKNDSMFLDVKVTTNLNDIIVITDHFEVYENNGGYYGAFYRSHDGIHLKVICKELPTVVGYNPVVLSCQLQPSLIEKLASRAFVVAIE
jgi:hypothetical protein